jgi:hypothetical protein
MQLNEFIAFLERFPATSVIEVDIKDACSYRGDYSKLAFIVQPGATTIGDLLELAKDQVGSTHHGYKGGHYRMDGTTDCYLVRSYDETGIELKTCGDSLIIPQLVIVKRRDENPHIKPLTLWLVDMGFRVGSFSDWSKNIAKLFYVTVKLDNANGLAYVNINYGDNEKFAIDADVVSNVKKHIRARIDVDLEEAKKALLSDKE